MNKIDENVGLNVETEPSFDTTYEVKWSGEAHDKTIEPCPFFVANAATDVLQEIRMHLVYKMKNNSINWKAPPCLDYCSEGNPKGITIKYGGDHADQGFNFHCQLNL
eukprot:4760218-Ditylum_brightwellii.AAC.1